MYLMEYPVVPVGPERIYKNASCIQVGRTNHRATVKIQLPTSPHVDSNFAIIFRRALERRTQNTQL